jgi:hypothetical protein
LKKSDLKILENKIHPSVRLNSICPYFTMFPLIFPYKVLSNAKSTDLVYDPFCGRGTTNYAARLLGISSYGVDSNPVAYAIAQAKLINVKPKDIFYRCVGILKNSQPPIIPQSEFWKLAYHQDTLIDLCILREYINNKPRLDKIDIALRAVILGILHGPVMKNQPSYLSNQMPRTFATKPDYSVRYWKERSLKPGYVNLVELIKRKAQYIFNEEVPKKVSGRIVLGDSRTLNNVFEKKFDWVITSPPYYGMSTYEQDQWLRNWFLGGPEKVEYSTKSQLKHWSENSFIIDLAKVWSNAAKKSKLNAKLIIRFGALPSKSDKTPSELIKESLASADCGWKIRTIQTAGQPIDSKRQANQFKNNRAAYIEEIDVFAILNA